jgi:SlyX protein
MDPVIRSVPATDVEARLSALEVKIGFIDDLQDALNRTVFRQQQQIDQLALALAALRQQVQTGGGPPGAGDPRDEIPPHY